MVYSKEGRWDQTERPYTSADVKRLSGSVKVEYTLAKQGAEKLWNKLHYSKYVSALGANTTATLGKRIRMDGAAVADIVSLTDGATINVDFNNSQNFAVQLGGNRALGNPSNCVPGQTGSFFFIQDGTGSRTLSFGANS